MHVATETNSIGAYRLCGIPADLAGVEVTAGGGRDRLDHRAAVMEAGALVGLVHVGLATDVDAEGRFVIPDHDHVR